jgi:hypothetical protein
VQERKPDLDDEVDAVENVQRLRAGTVLIRENNKAIPLERDKHFGDLLFAITLVELGEPRKLRVPSGFRVTSSQSNWTNPLCVILQDWGCY